MPNARLPSELSPPPWRERELPDETYFDTEVEGYRHWRQLPVTPTADDYPSIARCAAVEGPDRAAAVAWIRENPDAIIPTLLTLAFGSDRSGRRWAREALQYVKWKLPADRLFAAAHSLGEPVFERVLNWQSSAGNVMKRPRLEAPFRPDALPPIQDVNGHAFADDDVAILFESLAHGGAHRRAAVHACEPRSLEAALNAYHEGVVRLANDSPVWCAEVLATIGMRETALALHALGTRPEGWWHTRWIDLLAAMPEPIGRAVLADLAVRPARDFAPGRAAELLAELAGGTPSVATFAIRALLDSDIERIGTRAIAGWLEAIMVLGLPLDRELVDQHFDTFHELGALVWEVEGTRFFIDDDTAWRDIDDRAIARSDGPIYVSHPGRWSSDERTRWAVLFAESEWHQPFEQVSRTTLPEGPSELDSSIAGKPVDGRRLAQILDQSDHIWRPRSDDLHLAPISTTLGLGVVATLFVSPYFGRQPTPTTSYRIAASELSHRSDGFRAIAPADLTAHEIFAFAETLQFM